MTNDTDSLLRALEGLQLKVLFREHGWWECLIVGEETWRGEGADRAGALRDALRRALPTSLARALFEQRLAGVTTGRPAAPSQIEVVNFAIPSAFATPVLTIQPPPAPPPPPVTAAPTISSRR